MTGVEGCGWGVDMCVCVVCACMSVGLGVRDGERGESDGGVGGDRWLGEYTIYCACTT